MVSHYDQMAQITLTLSTPHLKAWHRFTAHQFVCLPLAYSWFFSSHSDREDLFYELNLYGNSLQRSQVERDIVASSQHIKPCSLSYRMNLTTLLNWLNLVITLRVI